MEHPDLAQLAAFGGALGSVLVLLARGRFALLAGLVVLGVSEAALAYSLGTGSLDRLGAPPAWPPRRSACSPWEWPPRSWPGAPCSCPWPC